MTIRASRPATRLLALAAPLVLAACGTADGPIVLGAAGPWHGSAAMNEMGIRLAVAELNARAEYRERPVEVRFANDSGNGALAARIAQTFVDDPAVSAVIGHSNSGTMMSAARVYDGRLVALSPTASSPDITGLSPWAFRITPSDSVNGAAIAQWAIARGVRRAAILYENNAYGRGLADAFRAAYRGEIIAMDPIGDRGDQNFEPHLAFYRVRKPALVFVAGTDGSGLQFMRQARLAGVDALFAGGDGWTNLASDPVASEGVIVGTPFVPGDPRPQVQRFVEAFKRAYDGRLPTDNAALAYDATMLAAEAARAGGGSRSAVREYLRALGGDRTFEGVTGAIAFTPGGDLREQRIVMARIEGGRLAKQ